MRTSLKISAAAILAASPLLFNRNITTRCNFPNLNGNRINVSSVNGSALNRDNWLLTEVNRLDNRSNSNIFVVGFNRNADCNA